MKITLFSAKGYDKRFFEEANLKHKHEISYFETQLEAKTSSLAQDSKGVCAFVNDTIDEEVLSLLKDGGTEIIALRCAGFNNVDLEKAHELGLCVCRVPEYSPYAVAEHTVGLILALNRRIHRAHARVRDGNFSLEGLLGFDLHGKTVGIIGTGKIGTVVVRLMQGFGCKVLAFDPYPSGEVESMGARYTDLDELLAKSDIVSLHCPLSPDTHHIINEQSINKMRDGVMLINTSRGALIDTVKIIDALKSGKIGYVGLDVYEEEGDLFFRDLSGEVIDDDVFSRLQTFPNVIMTGHQAFFTENALQNIAQTTLENVSAYEKDGNCRNTVLEDRIK